ncbi:hypothetical protein F2Q68_00015242 [Brassica cretica]|uniref:Uncharacterized protein n=1 Tax=Brassica cretica TaxID=69181 RepID=A0A8S9HDX9_BRACR|nr:hypothetical protein F2Q68_00015242 [Brassica cretica]
MTVTSRKDGSTRGTTWQRKVVWECSGFIVARLTDQCQKRFGGVTTYFGFCPSQLTPLTWRTLMAVQVLEEFHGFSIGVHEIMYSYYFAPLVNKAESYHLRSRDGAPLVEEPSRGIRGNYSFVDGWNNRYIFLKVREPFGYPTFWRPVISFIGEAVAKLAMGIPRRFRCVNFLVSREALRHSRVWWSAARLSVSSIYDEHQKAKTRKMRPFYTPPPRLVMVASSVTGFSSTPPTGAGYGGPPGSIDSASKGVSQMGAHEGMAREKGGAFESLRGALAILIPVRRDRSATGRIYPGCFLEDPGSGSNLSVALELGNVVRTRKSFSEPNPEVGLITWRSCKDPKVVWEPGGSSLDPEIVFGPGGHAGTRRSCGNPNVMREPGGSSLDPEIVFGPGDPEIVFGPGGHAGTEGSSLDPEIVFGPEVLVGTRNVLFCTDRTPPS